MCSYSKAPTGDLRSGLWSLTSARSGDAVAGAEAVEGTSRGGGTAAAGAGAEGTSDDGGGGDG